MASRNENHKIVQNISNEFHSDGKDSVDCKDEVLEQLYNNAKYLIDTKNISEFEKVLEKIIQHCSEEHSVVLILKAQRSSFFGDVNGVFLQLDKYLKKTSSGKIDVYALEILANFNLATENPDVALRQFSLLLQNTKNRIIRLNAMLRIAICKKRIGETELALQILEILSHMPEGCQNYLLLQIEILHNKVLIHEYEEVEKELQQYLHFKSHAGVIRLYCYTLYKLKKHDKLREYINSVNNDLYAQYILARVQLETGSGDLDIDNVFETISSSTNNNFAVVTTWANYKVSIGEYKKALGLYDLALKINFTNLAASSNFRCVQNFIANTNTESSGSSQDSNTSLMATLVDGDPEVESIGFYKSYLKDGFNDFIYNKTVFVNISPLDFYDNDNKYF